MLDADLSSKGAIQRILTAELLPLWVERGTDWERGGFHNRLGYDLRPVPDPSKRLLVQARQIYAMSIAARLGTGARSGKGLERDDWALAAAHRGLEFLIDAFLDRRHGGFFLTVSHDRSPEDRRKDLYAHAFVLFALAHYHAATAEAEALRIARKTFDLLRHRLADRRFGGFFEGASETWEPDTGLRRQNPHMHLLEAFLALHSQEPQGGWLAEAARIVALFDGRFYSARECCLREHFRADWSAAPPPQGDEVEPGHHFEWVWLLHEYATAAADAGVLDAARALFDFAATHGIDADGGVFDQVEPDGRVTIASKRLWPQLEHAQARAVLGDRAGMISALERCVARYRVPGLGGWHEHLDRNGRVVSGHMNATSVYHVTIALTEAMRIL